MREPQRPVGQCIPWGVPPADRSKEPGLVSLLVPLPLILAQPSLENLRPAKRTTGCAKFEVICFARGFQIATEQEGK